MFKKMNMFLMIMWKLKLMGGIPPLTVVAKFMRLSKPMWCIVCTIIEMISHEPPWMAMCDLLSRMEIFLGLSNFSQ